MCEPKQLLLFAVRIVPKREDTRSAGPGRLGDKSCRVDPGFRSGRLCQSQLGIPWLHSPPTQLGKDIPQTGSQELPSKTAGVIVGLQRALREPERTHTARVPRPGRVFLQASPLASRRQVSTEEGAPPPDVGCPQDSRKRLLWGFLPHHPLFYQSATIASKINKPKSGTGFQDKVTPPARHASSIFNNDILSGVLPPT